MNETHIDQDAGPGTTAARSRLFETLRFLAVALGGVVIDISISYLLATLLSVPLLIAAAVGFISAAIGNYVAHELWTFRNGPRQLSLRRSLHYVGASAVTLAVRIAVMAVLSIRLGGTDPLTVLMCGAGASFFFNFAISKVMIFSNRAALDRKSP